MKCYDKRVLIGLGAIAVGVLVLYPQWALAALPVLVVLACPLSMLLMMRTMNRGGQCETEAQPGIASADRDAEIASLHEEINILKAQQKIGFAGPPPVTAGSETTPVTAGSETAEIDTRRPRPPASPAQAAPPVPDEAPDRDSAGREARP
ncbi:MAG: DUF2933 domain-containing protein [Micromonosporaceae bacterium]